MLIFLRLLGLSWYQEPKMEAQWGDWDYSYEYPLVASNDSMMTIETTSIPDVSTESNTPSNILTTVAVATNAVKYKL